ncbi:hypothetical protein BP6252_02438 [Coleophoma cylindrospora]|uniref:Uncharacterized protein n=1 Tax=Coleophoma cylindrospora TaxID=1849047 RepID=A0A3D8SGG2_9HELO|nr:hypothetical protein BP6252_02438 [Coleophoma cylindrospora]
MTTQEYAGSVFVSFLGVIAFLSCVAVGVCVRRLWATRGFYAKDFHRISTEASKLSQATNNIRENVEAHGKLIHITDLDVLEQAEEWDTAIRLALTSWQDIMEPRRGVDIEAAEGMRKDKKMRDAHGRYVIDLMRRKAQEALIKRRELTYPLHKMQLAVNEMSKQASVITAEILYKRSIGNEKSEKDLNRWPAHMERILDASLAMPRAG